jgi:hypothetical protein
MIKWHYDRYLLFNRIKGEQTTVSDMANYEAKPFTKHIVQSNSVVGISNWGQVLNRVRRKKNVSIVSHAI